MYKSVVRPLLFWLSPSMSRKVFLIGLKVVNYTPILRRFVKYSYSNPNLKRSFFGLDFISPVGIASGVDWKAEFIDPLSDIGAAFVTVGPLTVRGGRSSGKVREVINNMREAPYNAGKLTLVDLNAEPTSSDEVKIGEFDRMYTLIYDFADASILNFQNIPVSIAGTIIDRITTIRRFNDDYKPILIHLNDEYSETDEDIVLKEILSFGIDGLVLSGDNECDAVERLRRIREKTSGLIPIMISNGVSSTQKARDLLENGASLISLKNSLFKEGPRHIKRILKNII